MKILFIFLLFIVYFALSLSLESTNAIGLYLIMSLGLFFWGVIEWKLFINRRNTERRRRLEEQLAEIPHSISLISDNLLNVMLIDDEVNNFLYILQRDSSEEDFVIDPIPFSDVLEVAIVEEEQFLNLYPKEGLLGSALMNAIDIMEDEDSDEEGEDEEEEDESIETLCLRIVVDNLTNPILEYPFIAYGHSLALDSEEYIEATALCNEWYQKLCIIIRRYEHSNVAIRLWQ